MLSIFNILLQFGLIGQTAVEVVTMEFRCDFAPDIVGRIKKGLRFGLALQTNVGLVSFGFIQSCFIQFSHYNSVLLLEFVTAIFKSNERFEFSATTCFNRQFRLKLKFLCHHYFEVYFFFNLREYSDHVLKCLKHRSIQQTF